MSIINYIRVRVLLYISLIVFYTLELLYEDYSIGSSSQIQLNMRQGFGFTLLSLSCAALACCAAHLEKSIVTCDAALFSFTIARVLLVVFAGFDGEAVFLALNVVNIFVFPLFDLCAKMEDNRLSTLPSTHSHNAKISSSTETSATSGVELRSHIAEDQLYEGFRVRVDRLPEASHVATNLPWSTFTHVEHKIDSSSCHIYIARWGERQVILKLIKADRIASPVAVAEFETEASVLSRIRHPHIVRFLGSGYQPRRFLVLELLDGGSLSHALGVRVDKDQRSWRKHFSYLDALKLGRAMAGALDYLHNHWHDSISIVHRDLKPDNIGFTSDGHIKLFDFGLCSVVRTKRKDFHETYEMTGNTGTLRYMAPEVALGKPYNQSVDIYSFGIILWQITKGRVPFSGLGRRSYMENVVMGGERPRCDRKWPRAFTQLLQRCWHEDKIQRPSFTEVISKIDGLIFAEETSARNRVLRLCQNTCVPTEEQFVKLRPVLLVLSLISLITSICVCVIKQSEVVGISLTVISSFIFYVIVIYSLRIKSRVRRENISGAEQAFNPLQQKSDIPPTAPQKLHGIDFI